MLEVRAGANPNPKSAGSEAFSISSDICLRFFYINSLRKKKILIRQVDGRLHGRASANDTAELLPSSYVVPTEIEIEKYLLALGSVLRVRN